MRGARKRPLMNVDDNPNWFANSPLTRLNIEKENDAFVGKKRADPASLIVPLWRGDPLIGPDGKAVFLSAAAFNEISTRTPTVFLGELAGAAHFGVDLSAASDNPETAPFADLGAYTPIRAAAGGVSRADLAIIGHARALFEWRRKHLYCPVCGEKTALIAGGAKAKCSACESEHFPRVDPVAIVLAVHDGACLLGRGPHFPAGFVSALAGYIEPGETPEEAARRELFEEAGVTLTTVRYIFSQPWPFPSTLMMGFIADAADRELTLDAEEIVEAHWVGRDDIKALIGGERSGDIFLPPKFTIARQLLEHWVK